MLPMPITFHFNRAPANQSQDHWTYEASAVAPNGTDYTIHGDYATRADGVVQYSFTQTYAAHIPKSYWTGTLADDGETLSGKWGYKKDDQPHTFVYKRTSHLVLVDRPLPEEFTKNRVKALWKYALTAIHNRVRRQLFSWSYLVERRDRRKEYLELLQKEAEGQLMDEDSDRATVLAHQSTFDDVRCFYIIQERRQRAIPPHM